MKFLLCLVASLALSSCAAQIKEKIQAVNLGVEVSIDKTAVIRLEDAHSIARIPAFGARNSSHHLGLILAGNLSLFEPKSE
jgi:hypothetical protein